MTQDTGVPEESGLPGGETEGRMAGMMSELQLLVLLRWVLIISTSYLVIFSRPLTQLSTGAAFFVCGYLASNLFLTSFGSRIRSQGRLETFVALGDTIAITIAHLVAGPAIYGSFVLYFVVIFLSALSERIGLILGATLLVGVAHLYTVGQFIGLEKIIDQGYLLRVPFLFAVALLFGYLVKGARGRERKETERRARAARLAFLSTVSHDLKNPLQVIQELAELLPGGDIGTARGSQVDLANRIRVTARHLTVLALNLIDAERIDAGRLTLTPKETRLEGVLDDPVALGQTAGQLKGVDVRLSVEPNLPTVVVDAVQTERIFSNLISNAVKFAPEGGRVDIEVRRDRDGVVVSVKDDGPGIPTEQVPFVFDKYRRAGETSGVAGSGLGLFIVKALVEAQRGHVHLASVVGEGTKVRVFFPAAKPRTPVVAAAEAASIPLHVALS